MYFSLGCLVVFAGVVLRRPYEAGIAEDLTRRCRYRLNLSRRDSDEGAVGQSASPMPSEPTGARTACRGRLIVGDRAVGRPLEFLLPEAELAIAGHSEW